MLSKKEWKKLLKKVPMIAVDGVVVRNNNVLLIERKRPPYVGHNVLPGGFVDFGETAEKAVLREVHEETGLKTKIVRLVGVYSHPKRDPRGHVVSVAFLLKHVSGKIKEGSETKNIMFFPVKRLPKRMGFDHKRIVRDALKMLQQKN